MKRDLRTLAAHTFDALVIGGGIHGLATAYDAAQRGMTVALVERGDFGAATSFNHLKTIHGGLRYLQSADLGRMRESIRERRAFARIAPRYVQPMAFVMPTESTATRNPYAMRAAFAIDALLSADRNAGLDAAHHLPSGRVISASDLRTYFAGAGGVTNAPGAMWFDYQTVENDRLTLSFALAAAQCGAALANYVEAIAVAPWGVRAKDLLTGDEFDVKARAVINAAGPWAGGLLAKLGVTRAWPMLKVMNLVTSRPARDVALVARTASGRALIQMPWQGRTLVGTSESPDLRGPDDQAARGDEVLSFMQEANEAFRGLDLKKTDITLVHRGIVPASKRRGGLALLGYSRVIDHAPDGMNAWISIAGVKYTTARAVAEHAIDLVLFKLGRRHVPSRTADVLLPGASARDRASDDPIRSAIETEMAQTLVDVVVRRTGLGAGGYPGDRVASETADAMRQILGWSDERVSTEIAALERFYEIE